jgi:glycosyltransferase involved in cell wall biosynthesis
MLSIIVPVFNEKENLQKLHNEILSVVQEMSVSFEIIFVDDGSTDDSWKEIETISLENTNTKGVRLRKNYGKSAALQTGFDTVSGDVVITLDADLQDSPNEIPGLYAMIAKDGYDLVSGWKQKRFDPPSKTIPTKLFNWATRKMSGIYLHDFNCGLKAYKKEVVKNIDVYGEMHRYIPVLAHWAGFTKIGEKIVQHQKRQNGITKFGHERFMHGFLDLISIGFVTKFGKRPMHLFGMIGSMLFLCGFIIAGHLTYLKFVLGVIGMTDRPLFYFGLLAMIIGTQLFLTGFISELIVRHSPEKNKYQVENKVGI